MDCESLDDYFCEFRDVSNYLLDEDLLSLRLRDSLYLQGFPKPLRSQILQRLLETKRSLLSSEVQSFENVHRAALSILGNCDLVPQESPETRQQDISRLKEEISSLAGIIAAQARSSQLCSSPTPGGVVQNPPQWGRACAFCSSLEHLVYSCPTATWYLEQGWVARYHSGRFCLPGGDPLPQLFPGANLQERVDSHWRSLQPCEDDRSPCDVFAAGFPESSSNYYPEQVDTFWMPLQPREDDRSYSDAFANTFPEGSGDYPSSCDVFLANDGQLRSSCSEDEISPSYLQESPAPLPLSPPEQHYPSDEFAGEIEEEEDPVESYLADFFEPGDMSSEVPLAVPSIPLPSLEDLFSSIPLSSLSPPRPSRSFAMSSSSLSLSSTLSQMSSLPLAPFPSQAASFSSQFVSSPFTASASHLASSYALRSPPPSSPILRGLSPQLCDLSPSSAYDLSSQLSSCSAPSFLPPCDPSPLSSLPTATHLSHFPPPGLTLQPTVSSASAKPPDHLLTSLVHSYPLRQSPSPQLVEPSSQNLFLKTGAKDSPPFESASSREDAATKKSSIAWSSSQDLFRILPKPPELVLAHPTLRPESSRRLRFLRELTGVLARDGSLVPLDHLPGRPVLCRQSPRGLQDLLGVSSGARDESLTAAVALDPPRGLLEAPMPPSASSQSCDVFLNLGRPPDILRQGNQLLDLPQWFSASPTTPRGSETCPSVSRSCISTRESAVVESDFAKVSSTLPISLRCREAPLGFLCIRLAPLSVSEASGNLFPLLQLHSTSSSSFPPSSLRSSLPVLRGVRSDIGTHQSLSEVPRRPFASPGTTEDGCYLKSQGDDLLSFLAMLGDSPRPPPTFRDFPRPILTSSQSLSLRDVFRCLPVVLHYSPLELFIAGASQTSLELPRLRWSSPVFAGALQSSLELSSLRWSSPVFAGVSSLRWSSSFFPGVPYSSPEFPIHLRSSLFSGVPFVSGVPYSSPEFLLLCRSFPASAAAPIPLRGFPFLPRAFLLSPMTSLSHHSFAVP